ncbi:MAG: hypothetical protein JRN06_01205 [Nitrososphaerota archaeon]|nr:hypothetical protein [Nitrososphaerota archaeon]MDG7023530.1 hypothetical protein [Nitrososphaerota archaeon]
MLLAAAGKPPGPTNLLEYESRKELFTDVFLPRDDSCKRTSKHWPRLATHQREQQAVEMPMKRFLQHISFARTDSRFDTLSNLLCGLWGVANEETFILIIDTMLTRNLSHPFLVRVLDPPIKKEDAGHDDNFGAMLPTQHRSGPLDYDSRGVWPLACLK